MAFDQAGTGTQADLDGGVFTYPADCFVTGSIAGRPVGCLSVRQQLAFHCGYEPREVDLTDLALLHGFAAALSHPPHTPDTGCCDHRKNPGIG